MSRTLAWRCEAQAAADAARATLVPSFAAPDAARAPRCPRGSQSYRRLGARKCPVHGAWPPSPRRLGSEGPSVAARPPPERKRAGTGPDTLPAGSVMRRRLHERLADHGWKPHRELLAQKQLSHASIYWHMRETQRGAVSSNSRYQTVLFQQYSTNLSLQLPQGPAAPSPPSPFRVQSSRARRRAAVRRLYIPSLRSPAW